MTLKSGRPALEILIADDVSDYAQSMAMLLMLHGYVNVRTAASGECALDMLLEKPADVAILDVLMGGVNGIDICRFIKAHRRQTFVIAVSGLTTQDIHTTARHAGVDAFLIKGNETNPLLETLDVISRVAKRE